MYSVFFKKAFDLIISLVAVVLLFPLFITVLLLLVIANQGKPLFFQVRPGLNGKLFKVVKFKTMNNRKDEDGNLLPDSKRLTNIGRFVRKTSIDELPQLINVIKGDMSLIGPRPLLPEYIPLYNPSQKRRHEVRPGITGWAQVNGRNAIGWEKKFEYDVWYVDHLSLALDLKIILMTIEKVFRSEGISQEGQVTMKRFTGTIEEVQNE
jgi:undecaprenyl phosphate N,N'-diacetylbacillosamine 1-phosphate transferase